MPRRQKTAEERAAQYLRLKTKLNGIDRVVDTGYDAFLGKNSTKEMYSRRFSRSKYKRTTEASDKKAQARIDKLNKRLDKAARNVGISTKVKVESIPGTGLGYMRHTRVVHDGSPYTKSTRRTSQTPQQPQGRRRMKTLQQVEDQYRRLTKENELDTPRRLDPAKTPRGKRIRQAYDNVYGTVTHNLERTKGGHAYQYIPEYTDGERGVSPWFYQMNYNKAVPSNEKLDTEYVKPKRDYRGDFGEYNRTKFAQEQAERKAARASMRSRSLSMSNG